MDYPIIVGPLSDDLGGGFIGYAPDLPGCMSDGDTPEEALANIKEAVHEWIDTARRRGIEIPLPGDAANRARAEKEILLSELKNVASSVDHIETRLHELERMVREIEDRNEHEAAWTRFTDITSVPVSGPRMRKSRIGH